MNNSNIIDLDFLTELALGVIMEMDDLDDVTSKLNADELEAFRSIYEESIKIHREMIK